MPSKKPNRFTKPPTPIPETPLVASALALEGVDLSEQRKDRLSREAMIEEMETEIVEGAREQARDMALWAETTPNSQDQARFFGNLTNRLLKGIPRKRIEEMTIRDRITAARQCYDMRQLEMDRPTANISFDQRFSMAAALPRLIEEVERRKRERDTIDIDANTGGDS